MYNNLVIAQDFSINLKRKIYKQNKKIAFVCIGTNKVIGDSLGPRVGSYLKSTTNLEVFGDLKNNVCNKEDIKIISHKLRNKYIIAIDSALSNYDDIGEIYITNKSLKLAEGLNIDKGTIGNICIKAVVARNMNDSYKNFLSLKSVDSCFIEKLAITVANNIRKITIKKDI